MNVRSLFAKLTQPAGRSAASGLRFDTVPIGSSTIYRIGKSPAGEPALLIAVKQASSLSAAPVRLESITVLHDAQCTVSFGGQLTDANFSLVALTSSDPYLRSCFLDLLPLFVARLGDAPSREEISLALHALVQLFRSVTKAPRASVQGLWSELFLMSTSANTEKLVAAWHIDPNERFDFSHGNQRIEVKSASGGREHHFSQEQLSPPDGVEVIVVSYLTAPSTGGVSIDGLLKRVSSKLVKSPDLQMRLIEVAMALLGTSFADGSTQAFDEQLARDSIRCFDVALLPRLEAIPSEIKRVQFVMAMDGLPSEPVDQVATRGGLFEAAVGNP